MNFTDQQTRALLDSAPDAMVIADENGTIVFVNAQTETLFGYSRQEFLGMPVEVLLPERFRTGHVSHRHSYTHAPQARSMGGNLDLYARRRDGSEFPVEISLSPFPTDSGLLISSTIRDVTDRKRMITQLRDARNEAEKANRAKSAFLAAASHDLRQPLQTLILLNSVLQKTANDPRAISAAATQHEALASLSELVNALLNISKLESGAIRPDVEDCSVRSIFSHLKASFEEQASSKGLVLIVEECDEVVRTDRGLLQQIMQNLLANAIRYTREGRVRLRCMHERAFVRIEVLDTGIGIPLDHHDTIFEEFRQLNRTPGDRREGLGLGLAIVRRIALLLEHPIAVDSTPGQGSCFTVTVPRGARLTATEPIERMPTDRAKNALIMLVDDDTRVARATQMFLELEGHQVWVASGLRETLALLQCEERIPDLILSDFHLESETTGIDVVTQIRALVGRSIPALIVTGDTSSRLMADVEKSSNCEVLSKPVVATELLHRIDRILQRRTQSAALRTADTLAHES